MKATGIVRRVDDLGRVVIPKEIRRTLAIQEGDALEIYTTDDSARETGSATANCDDTFIPSVGMVIALCRAVGWSIPQELLDD